MKLTIFNSSELGDQESLFYYNSDWEKKEGNTNSKLTGTSKFQSINS